MNTTVRKLLGEEAAVWTDSEILDWIEANCDVNVYTGTGANTRKLNYSGPLRNRVSIEMNRQRHTEAGTDPAPSVHHVGAHP
jgi:hypothetical protein